MPGGLDNPRVDHGDFTKYGKLELFDQTEFILGENTSLDTMGMIYTPTICATKKCRVHVSLHGCLAGMNNTTLIPSPYHFGDMYVLYSSYLQYAASNDIIILSPQVINTDYNINCCWDFFGYSGKNYFSK